MSEYEMAEQQLREQLTSLVEDRPALPSPAPLVITKVRRSRRRRAVAGAAALVAALIGGLTIGLPARSSTPQPATSLTLCKVSLPPAWSRALADPANVSHDGTLLAASADGKTRYVQEGAQIVRLDPGGQRHVLMTLPPVPKGVKATSWTVDGRLEFNNWFVVAITPNTSGSYIGTLGLYAFDRSQGTQQTLLQPGAQPVWQATEWQLGNGFVAWDRAPFRTDGAVMDGTTQHRIENMRNGRSLTTSVSIIAVVYSLALGTDDRGRLVGFDAFTGKGPYYQLPPQLKKAFHPGTGGLASNSRDEVFVWSTRKNDGGMTNQGWQAWTMGGGPVVQLPRPPQGQVDAGGQPIAPAYLVTLSGTMHATKPYLTDEHYTLVDLGSRSYATLPMGVVADGPAFAAKPGDAPHVLDLTKLPPLPHC